MRLFQEKINEFHEAVENNDYHAVRALGKVDLHMGEFKTQDMFIQNLVEAKRKVKQLILQI